MSNFPRQVLVQVGRILQQDGVAGSNKPVDHLAKLSDWTGVGRKALYNWTLPEDHAQYRAMPASTKRLVAMMAYFGMTGQLNDQRLKDIEALEAAMADQAQFAKIARRVSMVLKVVPSGGSEQAEGEGEHDESEHHGGEQAAGGQGGHETSGDPTPFPLRHGSKVTALGTETHQPQA